jgi:hypothetical protein
MMMIEAWLSHNAGAISCCKRLQQLTGLLYESTVLRLLRRHYAGSFLYLVYYHKNGIKMTSEAWLPHKAGAISWCRRLLAGLLYESIALRLLRRHYAGNF